MVQNNDSPARKHGGSSRRRKKMAEREQVTTTVVGAGPPEEGNLNITSTDSSGSEGLGANLPQSDYVKLGILVIGAGITYAALEQ